MEIRGVKIKKINRVKKDSGFFVLKPAEYYSVPLLAADGEAPQRAVNVGEKVSEGSLIARPSGRYGSFVYSPCSGKVVGVVRKLNARGNECEHVVIVRDLQEDKQLLPIIEEAEDGQEVLLKRLYESGMIDTFSPYEPAYKKYLLKTSIKHLIINCTEDEPYKTSDSVLIETYVGQVFEGAKLLQKVAKAGDIEFIFTKNQGAAMKVLKNHISKLPNAKDYKIKVYPNVYPLNNARLIAYYETGKMLSEGSRTAQVSVIVDNVANCYDFFNAVRKGQPCIERAVTISGNNTLRKANYFVKNGTPLRHILDVVGTKQNYENNMLIYGGIMSGIAQETLDVSLGLTISTLLFCDEEEYATETEMPCINCGRCVACCPVKLHVRNLDEAICDKRYAYAKANGVDACIKCGACSYVCPSKRYLAQRMSFAKDLADGKRGKNPTSSDYVLVAGEDVSLNENLLETDAEKLGQTISGENKDIVEMLSQLSQQVEKDQNNKQENKKGDSNDAK